MHVPAAARNFDAADIVFDQPPSQQATLSKRVASVAVAVFVLFVVEIKGFQFTTRQQAGRFRVEIGIGLNFFDFKFLAEFLVKAINQRDPFFKGFVGLRRSAVDNF